MWALANEYYADKVVNKQGASLGLASYFGYWEQKYYPTGITDIQESSFASRETYNVTGCEHRLFAYGCHPHYSPNYLIDATAPFVSAIIQYDSDIWDVVGFGTDSSLQTGPGWDPVTGVGVPNGLQFLYGIGNYFGH